jgi:hypothetical protein
MPVDLTDYEVTAPDGSTVKFRGPSSMSDDQVKMRAQQEWGFKTGKIPTTRGAGIKQSIGETIADNSGKVGTAVGLTGALLGATPVGAPLMAASPLIARGTQALGEKIAGRPITPTTPAELAVLGAEGAAGAYGPALIARSGSALTRALAAIPGTTLPQALAKGSAEAVGPAVTKIAARVTPQAIGEAAAVNANEAMKFATRLRYGVSAEDAKLLMDNINNGMMPRAAAKAIGGTADKAAALLKYYVFLKAHP